MAQLPFVPNQVYNRRADIHKKYGGNWQSGISVSSAFPYIFIFSGKTGHQHGYRDGWDNPDVFSYTGEGQIGDMAFTRGNLALRDHLQSGRRVFLFESERKGYARFICELEFHDADYFETHDRDDSLRIAIRFFFKRVGKYVPKESKQLDLSFVGDKEAIDYNFKPPNETERRGLVTSRVGQGAYRKRIIHRWEYKCAVTGFDKLNVLIASHIVPWSDSNDNERLDVNNGILLSPTYDALFDRHLISFENSGRIILSDKVEVQAFEKIGVTGKERIQDLRDGNLEYLNRHFQFFQSL
jgi:5-methylcytosine-specific restriction enzyme A